MANIQYLPAFFIGPGKPGTSVTLYSSRPLFNGGKPAVLKPLPPAFAEHPVETAALPVSFANQQPRPKGTGLLFS
jgi:hypothetical protein